MVVAVVTAVAAAAVVVAAAVAAAAADSAEEEEAGSAEAEVAGFAAAPCAHRQWVCLARLRGLAAWAASVRRPGPGWSVAVRVSGWRAAPTAWVLARG